MPSIRRQCATLFTGRESRARSLEWYRSQNGKRKKETGIRCTGGTSSESCAGKNAKIRSTSDRRAHRSGSLRNRCLFPLLLKRQFGIFIAELGVRTKLCRSVIEPIKK